MPFSERAPRAALFLEEPTTHIDKGRGSSTPLAGAAFSERCCGSSTQRRPCRGCLRAVAPCEMLLPSFKVALGFIWCWAGIDAARQNPEGCG